MWQALAGALIPVVLAIGLALTPWFRRDLLRPAKVVAVVAVVAVILFVLLPASWAAEGWLAIVVFFVALLAPLGVERLAARVGAGHDVTVDLAFGILLFHQVVDGVEIGTAHAVESAPWAVTFAIAAHSIPFVAAVILGIVQRRGPRPALIRGGALVLATGIGTVVGTQVPAHLEEAIGWLPALVGGLLLHVVWHDLDPHHDHHHDHDGHAH